MLAAHTTSARRRAPRQVEAGSARRAPITCLEFCAPRREAALCAQGSKAYVWSLAPGAPPRMQLVLDHGAGAAGQPRQAQQGQGGASAGAGGAGREQPDGGGSGGGGGTGDVLPAGPSDMRWLTQSDVGVAPAAGAARGGGGKEERECGSALPDLVAEAIRDAAVDIPEVTQASSLRRAGPTCLQWLSAEPTGSSPPVHGAQNGPATSNRPQIRWAGFREAWVTAADDDTLRLWSPAGACLASLASKGGRAAALFVDERRGLLLAAAADKAVYVYALDEPAPLARWAGRGRQRARHGQPACVWGKRRPRKAPAPHTCAPPPPRHHPGTAATRTWSAPSATWTRSACT